ncbi:tetratricopeptide repeat-containing sensor histidine kinase [Lutibacter flavus]|uniref:histidine kinase n=1 Tax=Lutibacter flavus TaxID=691689 RepID=A0A238VE35_9FLAO|nr:tetratricopeptide repeat-containing sensor histidine kinase [Lutibacter flavus]SNR32670.1 Signal transduction histidine kinase [Lutibacter flavus]
MRQNIIFIVIVFITFLGSAQNQDNTINYLDELYPSTQLDSAQVSKLIKKGIEYDSLKKIDSSYSIFKMALQISENIKSKHHIAECLYRIGIYFELKNNYSESINSFEKALVLYENLKDYESVAYIQNLIGYNYFFLNKEEKSIEFYFKSLTLYKSINNKDGVAFNLIDIGNLYYEHENYEFAKRYFEEALNIYLELEDKSGIAVCYTNIGNVTSDAGNSFDGIEYFFRSIEIEEEIEDFEGIGVNFNNIGDCYLNVEQFDNAELYFKKALKIADEIDDEELRAIVYLNLSDLNNKVHNYREAINYGEKSLEISKRIGIIDFELDNLKNISFAYENLGNKSKAFEILKQHKLINDSVIKSDKSKKIQLFNALNELEKSNFTIKELSIKNELSQVKHENEKKIIYGLIIAMAIFGFLIIILILQQASKKKAYNLLAFKNHQINRMNYEIQAQRDNLKQLNNTKDKFFSIIAHDLKNPFNSIRGFTELLIENINSYDDQKRLKFLKIIKGSTANASNLLNNLLIWANSQSGNLKYDPKKIELVKLVSDVVSLLEIQAINKEISIYNNVNHNLSVIADENMLNTILRNLISNAIKFSNPKGSIHIISTFDEEFVEITIKDNGIGMLKEVVDNLFNVEFKSSQTGTANEQGSGLGLILCKDFVEKHGGKIWVESIIDEGSEFKFTIPISK